MGLRSAALASILAGLIFGGPPAATTVRAAEPAASAPRAAEPGTVPGPLAANPGTTFAPRLAPLGDTPQIAGGGPAAVRVAPRAFSRPCPDSIFTCVTISVPRNHFAAGGPTWRVTFAIHRATAHPRKGVFVTVTGGPGTSGIAAADSYTEAFDPAIVANYDIVFLDQRGVGRSRPLDCPAAALHFYSFPGDPAQDAAQGRAYAVAAKRFAGACVAETGVARGALPYYSTRQAVEDLDAFRRWLGAPNLDLYGESYGTQYAQTYAAAYPGRVRALYLDGPVDLTLDGLGYYREDAHAFDTVLSMSLVACSTTPACRGDTVGRDSLAAYDTLARRLRVAPRHFAFVTARGKVVTRRFTIGDLETAAASSVYSTHDRMIFGRALAQATHGNLGPLARLAYIARGESPETLVAEPDPSYSDAMYYAVECTDYAYRRGTRAASARAYLAAGRAAGMRDVRLGSVFYGDLPCVYWPAQPRTRARPAPLTDTPYPIFVLASSTDPATPYAGALRIFERARNAYLIVQPGGPHVIFGRGNACPDDLVTAFLVDGTRPATRKTSCPWAGVDDYVANPRQRVASYRDALAAVSAMDVEIVTNADYWNWDGVGTLRFGCLFGGWIRYAETETGARLELQACRLSRGLAMTGGGELDTSAGMSRLAFRAPGGTDVTYEHRADGVRSVTGTWFGAPVSITR